MFKLVKKCEFNYYKWDQDKKKKSAFNEVLLNTK